MILELPMCPSGNRYWRVFRGRAVKSEEAREYIAKVKRLYRPVMLLGRVAVRLDLYLCRGDIDNRAKVALDALKGIAYRDDRQVRSLQVEGYEASSRTQRIVARITPWVPVRPMELDARASEMPAIMLGRHTGACIVAMMDPGATCICRPPAVEEPLFHAPMPPALTLEHGFAFAGRATPNVVRRKP